MNAKILVPVLAALLLSACGNKGPLVMPQKPVPVEQEVPTPPAEATPAQPAAPATPADPAANPAADPADPAAIPTDDGGG